jgi:hypothetical protein
MNEIYLLLALFLGVVFGYFVSKASYEELKELSSYLNYAYIFTVALLFGVAAYFNIIFAVIVFLIVFFLAYFYNTQIVQNMVLFFSGVLIFFVNELFVFSVVLFINLMILTSIRYNKKFIKNVFVYLYFLIPALIVFCIKFFLGV